MQKFVMLIAISCLLGSQAHGQPQNLQYGSGYCVDLSIMGVGWIDEKPNPLTQLIGDGVLDKPNWIVRTYMGLIGTANKAPTNPMSTSSMSALLASKDFRAINFAQIKVNVDPHTLAPLGETSVTSSQDPGSCVLDNTGQVHSCQDPGWTPPIDQGKFLALGLAGLWSANVNDRNYYRAEISPISSIVYSIHPNNVISFEDGETVLVSSVMKFRAGQHTDNIGVSSEVGSPFHVPWLWNEFALSYYKDQYLLHISAAKFPTTYWYINGQLQRSMPQVFDTTFPKRAGFSSPIDVNKLQIYPVLSAGAPSSAPQSPIDDPYSINDPVIDHPFTAKLHADDTIIVQKDSLGAPHPCLPPPQMNCMEIGLLHPNDPRGCRPTPRH